MFFYLLKLYARIAVRIYCRRIRINKPEFLRLKGPLLLAANHPNSFLDGVIMTTLFEENIYSLARGDVFKKPFFRKILYKLHLLPVYRTSEGTENLSHNYTTFAACLEVFKKNGVVIIFSEGGCRNEWHLRPLRKGTARLAVSAWKNDIELTVIPVGFNYSGFRNFGKNLDLNFGEPLQMGTVLNEAREGKQLLEFNRQLEEQLRDLVYEIGLNDRPSLKNKLGVFVPLWQKILLLPFAIAALFFHAPLYVVVKTISKHFFDDDHFDSVVTSLLFFTYPIYMIIAGIVAYHYWGLLPTLIFLALMPLSAWALVRVKPQFNKHFRAHLISG